MPSVAKRGIIVVINDVFKPSMQCAINKYFAPVDYSYVLGFAPYISKSTELLLWEERLGCASHASLAPMQTFDCSTVPIVTTQLEQCKFPAVSVHSMDRSDI